MAEKKRVALVTGGGRGIGLGISRALAREGCDLVVGGVREEDAVAEALTELRDLGAQVCYCQSDVGAADARARMLARIRERCGRLDILVNNAGVAPRPRADVLDATEESFERVMRINLQGPYFLTQAVARWFVEQRRAEAGFAGMILNISSVSAVMASVNRGDYCISKAGLSMATQIWAARLAEFGIPVYEIQPGITRTDMTAAVKEKYDRLIESDALLERRWGLPEDVGRVAAMMARGDLPYATGQVVTVAGGLTQQRL